MSSIRHWSSLRWRRHGDQGIQSWRKANSNDCPCVEGHTPRYPAPELPTRFDVCSMRSDSSKISEHWTCASDSVIASFNTSASAHDLEDYSFIVFPTFKSSSRWSRLLELGVSAPVHAYKKIRPQHPWQGHRIVVLRTILSQGARSSSSHINLHEFWPNRRIHIHIVRFSRTRCQNVSRQAGGCIDIISTSMISMWTDTIDPSTANGPPTKSRYSTHLATSLKQQRIVNTHVSPRMNS